jgi:5S rRNA maturation endonuclease (ribonuclease M5)
MAMSTLPTIEHPEQEFCDLIKVFTNAHTTSIAEDYDVKRDVHEPLLATYAANGPSQYFQSRGFSDSVLATFGVTDCNNRYSPFFRRSLIPIHSDSGAAIAIIARSMMDFVLPKYIFTKGFKKAGHFYNWHRAVARATELSCMFICEGQGDVWRLWESGVTNCCSLFGKELSAAQRIKLFSSEITTLVILTDNDQAGRESKITLQRELSRFFTMRFPRFKTKDIGELPVEKVVSDILPQVQGLY